MAENKYKDKEERTHHIHVEFPQQDKIHTSWNNNVSVHNCRRNVLIKSLHYTTQKICKYISALLNVWKWFLLVYKLYAIDKHVTWRKFTDTYRFHKSIVLLQNTNKISFSLSDISLQSDKYIQQMIKLYFWNDLVRNAQVKPSLAKMCNGMWFGCTCKYLITGKENTAWWPQTMLQWRISAKIMKFKET